MCVLQGPNYLYLSHFFHLKLNKNSILSIKIIFNNVKIKLSKISKEGTGATNLRNEKVNKIIEWLKHPFVLPLYSLTPCKYA